MRQVLALVVGVALGVAAPRHAAAQREYRWSGDATVGGAAVSSGEFLNNSRAAAHLALAGRVLGRGQFAMYAEAGYDWFGRFGLLGANPDLVCIKDSPGGGCRPSFPDVAGLSASIGLVYAPFAHLETRVGVGGAAYSLDGTRVGAALGQLDVAAFPVAHIGFVLSGRFAVIPNYRQDHLTMRPVLFGLRVR